MLADAVSAWRYARLGAGVDLTLFTQAVTGYAAGQAPIAPAKASGFNLLGDHFHPVMALLAPLYRIWPDPRALLLGQALLVGLSCYVVTRAAQRHLRPRPALLVAVSYLLSWPLQSLSGFDIHEVAFAVPLLALSLSALLDDRHVPAAAWALPLLLVKEDQALTVAALGAVLAIRGSRRLGAGLAAAGVAGFVVITSVVIPALSYYGYFTYWTAGTGQEATTPTNAGAVAGVLGHLADALSSPHPWRTGLLLLLPVLGLCLRSPLILVALPSVGIRLISSNEGMWQAGLHYDATIGVIVFIAAIDVLRRWTPRAQWRLGLAWFAVAVALTPSFALGHAVAALPRGCPTCPAADAVLTQVPDGADVAADVFLGPRLVSRTTTRVLMPGITDSAGHPLPSTWAVLDTRNPDAETVTRQLDDRGFRELDRSGPYVVYRR